MTLGCDTDDAETVVGTTVVVDGYFLRIDLGPLAKYEEDVTVAVPDGVVRDEMGNPLRVETSGSGRVSVTDGWTFTLGPHPGALTDIAEERCPNDGATDVAANTNIVLRFSRLLAELGAVQRTFLLTLTPEPRTRGFEAGKVPDSALRELSSHHR